MSKTLKWIQGWERNIKFTWNGNEDGNIGGASHPDHPGDIRLSINERGDQIIGLETALVIAISYRDHEPERTHNRGPDQFLIGRAKDGLYFATQTGEMYEGDGVTYIEETKMSRIRVEARNVEAITTLLTWRRQEHERYSPFRMELQVLPEEDAYTTMLEASGFERREDRKRKATSPYETISTAPPSRIVFTKELSSEDRKKPLLETSLLQVFLYD